MGCTPSKLDNNETVKRCKERKRLLKHSLHARHRIAAAHSDYCRSLRTTGASLATFTSDLPFPVSGHSAAVILRRGAAVKSTFPAKHPQPQPKIGRKIPSLTESCRENTPAPEIGRKIPMKVPHILSDSTSISSNSRLNENGARFTGYKNGRENSNTIVSSTTSPTSSVWNWDDIKPPPTPPDSEYFDKLRKNKRNYDKNSDEGYYGDCNNENDDKDSSFMSNSEIRSQVDQFQIPIGSRNGGKKQFDNVSSYSRFYSENRNDNYSQGHENGANVRRWEWKEEEAREREEVECSEWGDHDHHTSICSSSDEEGDLKMKSSKNEEKSRLKHEAEANANVVNVDPSKLSSNSTEGDGKNKEADSGKSIMVRHKDLLEIVNALKEYFDKAADAGEQVSQMLEFDRRFTQLRKTEHQSTGMLNNLNTSWTFKPPLPDKYRSEPNSFIQAGCSKSLRFTLERLLVLETQLYKEVKAREGVKIKLEKEVTALQNQEEYRGIQDAKLDKKRASIDKLKSLLSVKSQDVSAISSTIIRLKDSDFVPQIVELCHGFMYMWKSMNQHHEIQNSIVQQVQGLVNHTPKNGSTSDLHRQATIDLQSALSAWHSSFRDVMRFQRDFISSLHGWFKLTLLHVNGEVTKDSTVFSFLEEWKLALDQVPDSIPSETIKSFINVINSIYLKQTEDVRIRRRAETFAKELERKGNSLRNVERKYYKSYSTIGLGIPDNAPVSNGWDPLAEKKAEVSTYKKRVEDEMARYCKAVEETRAMTLNNIQTGLPGVFQAVVTFSGMMVEALEAVCNRTYAI